MQKTAIVVDDESHVRLYIRSLLISAGMKVVGEAANGEEALLVYRQQKPDLVLMDLNMPGRNGEEALQDILREFPDARIVMLSSIADRAEVEKCLQLGAEHYIRKDCPPAEIRNLLKTVLE